MERTMHSMARRHTMRANERSGAGGALPLRLLALAAGIVAAGCTGAVADGPSGPGNHGNEGGDNGGMVNPTGGSGGSHVGTGGTGGATPVNPAAVKVGISPLRRLTAEQYRNTVRDLLGMKDAKDVVATTDLPADGAIADRFSGNTVAALQGLDADTY